MFTELSNNKSALVVDLQKVKNNYQVAKSFLNPSTICGSVVKANAYGLGFLEISQTLFETGCKHFFVAYLSEAIELRVLLPNVTIYTLMPINEKEFEECFVNNITPVLNDLSDIKVYNKFAMQKDKKLPFILHIDTGMTRLGLTDKQFYSFCENKEWHSHLEITYIMSHLSRSDEPQSDMNTFQLEKFKNLCKFLPDVKMSLANSSGICLGKDYHFDMVRPGCMLYGINPTLYINKSPVETVATLYGKVLQVRTLTEDQPVSYGFTYQAKKGDKIATVACGYADGYHRIMSNNTYCYFKGYQLPIIGIITMDMLMVDVNSLPEKILNEFNFVELLGDNVKVETLATNAKTIGYEILTSLGNRFNRIYV